MAVVFLVTSGCYSDYGVEAVFSTLELATAYLGSRSEDVRIEPYTLDDPSAEPAIRRPWEVQMYLDGHRDDNLVSPHTPDIHPHDRREPDARILTWANCRKAPVLAVHCWADDERHAVKITNEIRSAYNAGAKPLPHWHYDYTSHDFDPWKLVEEHSLPKQP